MTEQPMLQTPRLLLRPFTRADDVTGMAEAWIAGHPAEFAAGTSVTYAVTLRDGGALTGAVSLAITPRHRRAEMGYWAGVPFWGQGHTTEASAALIEYAFGVLGLHKVTASASRAPTRGCG